MQGSDNQVWNVPNKISAARLVLSVVVFALIPLKLYWLALVVFVTAAGTDWIDGWYARKYNQVTQLGRILDPFCDKILICGTFILLAIEMRNFGPWYITIAGWMAVLITGRELLVTVLRSLIEGAGGDFSAKMSGKLKMWFQCIAAGACLYALATNAINMEGGETPLWLTILLITSIWAAIASTIHSGWLYVLAANTYLVNQTGSSVTND